MHGVSSQAFSPEELQSLDTAFNTTWAMFILVDPSRDPSKDEELKTLLRNKLLAKATVDIDEEDMRQIALECLRSPR
jgi:hypothetical protein